jgi:lysyl-tRNA synthetase class I
VSIDHIKRILAAQAPQKRQQTGREKERAVISPKWQIKPPRVVDVKPLVLPAKGNSALPKSSGSVVEHSDWRHHLDWEQLRYVLKPLPHKRPQVFFGWVRKRTGEAENP